MLDRVRMYEHGCWELQPNGAVKIGLRSAGGVKGDNTLFAYSGTVRDIVGCMLGLWRIWVC